MRIGEYCFWKVSPSRRAFTYPLEGGREFLVSENRRGAAMHEMLCMAWWYHTCSDLLLPVRERGLLSLRGVHMRPRQSKVPYCSFEN